MDNFIQSLVIGDAVNTEEIADQFVKALTEDRHKLERGQGESISDSAIHAPNLGTQVEKRYGIAHIIARKCFADIVVGEGEDSSSEKTRKWQYILYKRLIRDLRNTLREHKRTLATAKENSKKKTPPPHKDAPLSEVVLEPTAMPVQIPLVEEFQPFFEFLEQNQKLRPDDGEIYPYTPHTRFLQFKRGAVYTDQRMDLCKQVVGPNHISQLMTSLRKNQQIVHFLLGNNIIGKVGAQAIADSINDQTQETNKIITWYLAGNDIDEEGMAIIAQALETDSVCQSLWLKRNPIKLGGVKHLAHTLTVNHTIKVLDLSNTGILDNGAEVLFSALSTNYGVRFLYLDANGLSGKTAGYIVEYITKLDGRKGVTSMWLSMNRFHDNFIPAFKALGGYEHLKRLNVGSGRLGANSARAIYEAFAHHSRLKVLDVGMYKATYDMGELPNAMGYEGAKWLAMLIKETKSLLEVAFNGNGMTNAGLELLARALVENKSGVLFVDYVDRENFIVKEEIKDEISKTLERNLRVHYGETDLSKLDLQVLKKRVRHGKRIFDIDSVYRNRSKS